MKYLKVIAPALIIGAATGLALFCIAWAAGITWIDTYLIITAVVVVVLFTGIIRFLARD